MAPWACVVKVNSSPVGGLALRSRGGPYWGWALGCDLEGHVLIWTSTLLPPSLQFPIHQALRKLSYKVLLHRQPDSIQQGLWSWTSVAAHHMEDSPLQQAAHPSKFFVFAHSVVRVILADGVTGVRCTVSNCKDVLVYQQQADLVLLWQQSGQRAFITTCNLLDAYSQCSAMTQPWHLSVFHASLPWSLIPSQCLAGTQCLA